MAPVPFSMKAVSMLRLTEKNILGLGFHVKAQVSSHPTAG